MIVLMTSTFLNLRNLAHYVWYSILRAPISLRFVYIMSEESYDGYGHVKQLNANTTQEELAQLYSAWSKTYDQVNIGE